MPSLRNVLAFTALVEAGTGLVLLIDPAIVVALLLGLDIAGVGLVVGRCFGIALLTLGIACWPGPKDADSSGAAVGAMLVYNALIACYLASLGALAHIGGVLLWPAAALHAVVALLLALNWREGKAIPVNGR